MTYVTHYILPNISKFVLVDIQGDCARCMFTVVYAMPCSLHVQYRHVHACTCMTVWLIRVVHRDHDDFSSDTWSLKLISDSWSLKFISNLARCPLPSFQPLAYSFPVQIHYSSPPTPSQPPRDACPVVLFDTTDVTPLLVENFPFDKYELEPSPLTQYILGRRNPNVCWQVH